MKVGDVKRMRGFITHAHYMRGISPAEVEQRIGYRFGRSAEGWWLCFLTQMPTPQDFEFRGYSQTSGGVAQGHLPRPPDPRNAEQRLRDDGHDLPKLKRHIISTVFQLQGAKRLAKVIPVRDAFGADDYPPGKGIPQWTLVRELPFQVAAYMSGGQSYMGNYT